MLMTYGGYELFLFFYIEICEHGSHKLMFFKEKRPQPRVFVSVLGAWEKSI